MRLKNVLIAVNDMDKAIRFYKEIFGLQVILNQDGNVILSKGLVLQDAKIWKKFLEKELIPKNNMSELYFEEPDVEAFVRRLEKSDFEIEFVSRLLIHSWGQKVVRFYDLDGNLIEVGTPVNQEMYYIMNIQIFGTKKCNETKKAERFFKERGIKYQFVDMKEKGCFI